MTQTANLIFENRKGDFLISKKDVQMFNGEPVNRLVEFRENNEDENEWGQVRFYRSGVSHDDQYIIQLRGRSPLTENGEKRNLIAIARLNLTDLQKIVFLAEEISGHAIQSESDQLRIRIQELEESNAWLRVNLKAKQDSLQMVMEG